MMSSFWYKDVFDHMVEALKSIPKTAGHTSLFTIPRKTFDLMPIFGFMRTDSIIRINRGYTISDMVTMYNHPIFIK